MPPLQKASGCTFIEKHALCDFFCRSIIYQHTLAAVCQRHQGSLGFAQHRFSAVHREYKYFVLQRPGAEALDVSAMQAAADHFVGEHDFRNFCKVALGSACWTLCLPFSALCGSILAHCRCVAWTGTSMPCCSASEQVPTP